MVIDLVTLVLFGREVGCGGWPVGNVGGAILIFPFVGGTDGGSWTVDVDVTMVIVPFDGDVDGWTLGEVVKIVLTKVDVELEIVEEVVLQLEQLLFTAFKILAGETVRLYETHCRLNPDR